MCYALREAGSVHHFPINIPHMMKHYGGSIMLLSQWQAVEDWSELRKKS